MTSRLEIMYQYSVHWPMDYEPILRVVWLAMFGIKGQSECDKHSVVLLWNKYISPSTKIEKCVPIPLPFFAFVAEGAVGALFVAPRTRIWRHSNFFPASLTWFLTEGVFGIVNLS